MSNPLVAAGSTGQPTPWAGVWIAEDVEAIVSSVSSGSWIDGTLGTIGAGLDALAFVSDPIGGLLQYGIAWLIEHVKPLSEALDWLAGDPAQIAAQAATWRNVAEDLRADSDELLRSVRWDVSEWTSVASDAYRNHASARSQSLLALSRAGDAMALMIEGAGMLIGTVRILVRDAVATVVSRLIVYAGELLATAGLATPVVAEQVSTLCASWAAKISRWLKGLISSLRRLGELMTRLGRSIRELTGRREGAADAHGATDVVDSAARHHGGHSTRLRNEMDFERQDQWANDAYDDIRRSPDADVIAENLGDVPRADGTTGFPSTEIETIRQHIFFSVAEGDTQVTYEFGLDRQFDRVLIIDKASWDASSADGDFDSAAAAIAAKIKRSWQEQGEFPPGAIFAS